MEVKRALDDLNMDQGETRPRELKRCASALSSTFSGLVGPHMAHVIINQQLRIDGKAKTALADSFRYMDERLERSHSRLEGLNADLDTLRRYHRQILLDLPLGVCAVAPDHTVVIWNLTLELMSGVSSSQAEGRKLSSYPSPGVNCWQVLPSPRTGIFPIWKLKPVARHTGSTSTRPLFPTPICWSERERAVPAW